VVRQRSAQLAWLITGPMACLAIILIVAAISVGSADHLPILSSWKLLALFFVLFAAAEATTLNFEVLRHGMSVSLTEIPLLLALFYLSPLSVLLLRVVANALIQSRRRVIPLKQAFNTANVGAGMAIACLVVARFGPIRGSGPHAWLILLVAVFAAVVSSL
jgi:hypothetical protein